MHIQSLTDVKNQLAAISQAEGEDYIVKHATTLKFLWHLHGTQAVEELSNDIKLRTDLKDLIQKAQADRDKLVTKWIDQAPDHNPSLNVADIDLPDTDAAIEAMHWPLSDALQPLAWELLNRKFAVVPLSGKTRIVTFSDDEGLVAYSEADFLALYKNRLVIVPVDDDDVKSVPLAKLWLASTARRQFINGTTFDPSTMVSSNRKFNLWKGFAVEPDASKPWGLFDQHLRDVISSGDEFHYRFLMAWMAQLVQQPHVKMGTAIALTSDAKGTGKSTVGRVLRQICGGHSIAISQRKHVTGQFNGHLVGKILVVCEEAFWSGDQEAKSVMKALITEDRIATELKGINVFDMPNFARFLITTNDAYAVPTDEKERRYFTLAVSDQYASNRDYFDRLNQQMFEDGGCAGFLAHLLAYDLTDVKSMKGIDLRCAPKTAANMIAVMEGAPPEVRAFREILIRGYVEDPMDECDPTELKALQPTLVPKSDFFADMRKSMGKTYAPNQLGSKLKEVVRHCGIEVRSARCSLGGGKRTYFFEFPPLEEMRAAFERKFGKGSLGDIAELHLGDTGAHENVVPLKLQWDATAAESQQLAPAPSGGGGSGI